MQSRTDASDLLISKLAPVLTGLCDNSPKFGQLVLIAEIHDGQLVALEAGSREKFKIAPANTAETSRGSIARGAK